MYEDMMDTIGFVTKYDPEVGEAMRGELQRQKENIELIASENIVSPAVMAAMGSCLTNKYAEGYPGKRYYGGCQNVDVVETIAIERAKKLFGAEFANVQPHSGAQANLAVYTALLKPGDTVMGMNLAEGGHLTHGAPVNLSGQLYHFVPCSKEVGALLMVDMAHIAGLVAGGVHPSPVPYADVVTTTTHKTLRGPRGGLILAKKEYGKAINKAVFPGMQGGPLEHVIAGKAVCLGEALKPEFRQYAEQIVRNARALAESLMAQGIDLVSGGTDNHLMLVDLRNLGITGRDLETRLDSVHITVNKNAVPNDPQKPLVTSGVRIGTAAVTTRGMKEEDMAVIAGLIAKTAKDYENTQDEVKSGVAELCRKYPLY